jgi:hypothetical protein
MADGDLNIADQYVRLARSPVAAGLLRGLVVGAGVECLGPLLILLLLARARTAWVLVRAATLQKASGVIDAQPLRESVAALATLGAIEVAPDAPADVFRFRVDRVFYARRDEKYYVLPGRLVTTGVWKDATPDERAVLWCLAAKAKSEVWNVEQLLGLTPCAEWATTLGSCEATYDHTKVRRLGFISAQHISDLTGIPPEAVQRAVAGLASRSDGAVVRYCANAARSWYNADGFWYHLPESLWGFPTRAVK